ncbi:hypothetical protein IHE44_0000620 [Lamprotornis superbus]|uniref:Uncharacterized protein n=1 Tax=Lamprotornis superbus TaxID=245042 RepID=A0A835U0E9_9PASS|nr:hypothetical protein IHE44_0000620 [Lamprotornis superbus]
MGRGSRVGELLLENRIMWVKGRWDKYLEDRQERIIAKYIKASAACSMVGSWEGSVLGEAVKGGSVQCTCPCHGFCPFLRQDSYMLIDFARVALTASMTLLLEETTVIEKYFVQNYFIRHR